MTGMVRSTHATQRLAQRGVSASDLDWVLYLGREVESGMLVLNKDAEAVARYLEHLAGRVRRLGGMRIVRADGVLVTVYRASSTKQKRLLRRSERRNLET